MDGGWATGGGGGWQGKSRKRQGLPTLKRAPAQLSATRSEPTAHEDLRRRDGFERVASSGTLLVLLDDHAARLRLPRVAVSDTAAGWTDLGLWCSLWCDGVLSEACTTAVVECDAWVSSVCPARGYRRSCAFHRVDAVDFHDSGDEEDGEFYDLIEDPKTGEKYK